jgi:GNAT superfamily N-acetyltransferase
MIVTHLSYKGQGHAKRLIQMGLRFADEKRRKWYAACWPTSVKLYRQLGFQYLAQEAVDLSKYGGEGKEVLALLVKEPARSVVEELRHQLLD